MVKRKDESVYIVYPQLNNDKDIINAWGLLRQVIIATRAQRDGSETEPGNFGKGKHILPFILGAIAVLWSGNAFAEGLLSLVKKFPAPSFFVFSSVCMACLMIYLILYEQPARFRPKRFDVFIDELAEKAKSGQGIRVLSAGCHTGKETYNVAAALLKRGIPKESIKVVGIDNSEHRITKAKRGIYGGGWATHYYLHRYTLDNYFEKLSDGSYKVKQGLRDIVEFRECDIDDENAMSSLRSSFGLFDGVICWGVLYSGNKKARKNLAFVCKDDASLKVDNGECVVNIRKMISKRKARSSPDRDPLSELRKPHLLSAAARDDEEVFGETATDGRREAQEQLKQKIIEHINASPDVAPAIEELKKIFEELMAESGLTKTHFDQVIKELCDEGVVERIRVSNEVLLRTAYIKKLLNQQVCRRKKLQHSQYKIIPGIFY